MSKEKTPTSREVLNYLLGVIDGSTVEGGVKVDCREAVKAYLLGIEGKEQVDGNNSSQEAEG